MSKEWSEIGERGPTMSQIRVGDIVGVRGNRPGIYRVSRITQSGQFTLVSTDPQSAEKPQRFLPRGNEVGSGSGYGHSAWITGTDRVRTMARRCQYAIALYDLYKFVEDLYQSHDGLYRGFGNSTGANGTPITRTEYVELARLAKLCLDDGQNADITRASLANSYMERKRRAEAAALDEDATDGDSDA